MILAAHHPCYLPSLSFFFKLASADVFVLADDYQYTTHNFINRTRIKTADGSGWLTVPVLTKGRGSQKANEMCVNHTFNWPQKHLRALEVNYCYAAYFEQYIEDVAALFSRKWRLLVDLNLALIDLFRSALGISTPVSLSSALRLEGKGSTRLLDMLGKTGCGSYLADAELKTYLKRQEFEQNNFVLQFLDFREPAYHQQFGDFTPGLSVADLLFNEGPESRNILMRQRVVSSGEPGV
ncbi:WbqC family protein [candidate division KSB1 bacterium]|nr:WbqC family protein [candidate division KSB1 bacterium]